MNFLKRAGWRLAAQLGKTVMLTGLFFVICTLVLSGFLIQTAAARAADDAKESVGAVATMQLDLNALINSGKASKNNGATPGTIGAGGDLHRDLVDRMCGSSAVTRCNYSTDSGAKPTDRMKLYEPVPLPAGRKDDGLDFFKADGVRDLDALSAFRNGDDALVSGTGIKPDSAADVVVIEERLAKANGLAVGDRVTLRIGNAPIAGQEPDTRQFDFVVGGVYRSGTPDSGSYVPAMTHPANQIYVTPEGGSKLLGKDTAADGGVVKSATFTLRGPDDLDRLKADARAAGADLGIFPLTVNDKAYKTLVGPITRTAAFAGLTVGLVAVAGTAILALVVASNLRERRSELGILMSLGEKKPKLLGQHLVEVAACALVAIGLAAAGSQVLSQAIGDRLLAGEVSSARAQGASDDGAPDPGAVNGITSEDDGEQVEPIDRIDIRTGPADIARIGATGLGIAALATLVPGIRVLRLTPRDILSKGN
ncbi:ABC transporter permease [Streptomyces subrutilus]|uniref:ABC transporter permease n=1 Tax=Streptomyces subrutilus TaxID=36818 RepID=UPI002E15DC65|nr:FtsX-like permease family protein [Streptomyces subrutilus]